MKHLIILLCGFLSALLSVQAAILGGELTYTQTGPGAYTVHLTWFRDYDPAYEPVVWFAAYTLDDYTLIDTFASIETGRQILDTGYPTCVGPIEWFNIERIDYATPIALPDAPAGYLIVLMGNNRTSDISNVLLPGARGMTLYTTIPGGLSNNAPTLNASPVWYTCSDVPLVLDLSASEPDGDALEYRLVAALDTEGPAEPFIEIASPPPYPELDYLGALTPLEPFASATEIILDAETGMLTALPTTEGVYVITVMVTEKRLGVDISEMRRDFILIVEDCVPVTPYVDIGNDIFQCNNLSVEIDYEIDEWAGYYWDMGDGTTIPWPLGTYTYDTFGDYTVSYIANYGAPCADTFQIMVHLNESAGDVLAIDLSGQPENCFYDTVTLIGSPDYTVQWFDANTGVQLGLGSPFEVTQFEYQLDATAYYYDDDFCYMTDTVSTFFYPNNMPVVQLNQDNPQWILYIDNAFDPYVAGLQWYKDGAPVPGATEAHLPLTACGLYHAEITDDFGCVFTGTPESYCNSDIAFSEAGSFYFSPNPVSTHGVLHHAGSGLATLTLVNTLGEMIWQQTNTQLTADIPIMLHVSAGVYYIHVRTDQYQVSIPVVVN